MDEKDQLARLWTQGIPTPEIARVFGATIIAVESTVRALKVRRPEPAPFLADRRCRYCNAPMVKRPGQTRTDYARRQYCSRKCRSLNPSTRAMNAANASRQNRTRRERSKAQLAHTEKLKAQHARRPVAPPQLAPGEVESVDAYLARGGSITRCPSAYAAPVEPQMVLYSGMGVHRG